MTESDNEANFAKFILAKNRRQRKSGGWQVLGLDYGIFKGIERKGYRQPTPIQRKTIPLIIDGKDVVAMSRTGSGKTAAFVVPMLQKLKAHDTKGIRAVIIEPIRELAIQTHKVVRELARFTDLKCACLVGGDLIEEQFATIHAKPDILIATPGRLLHVVVEMDLRLFSVQYIVFDEADRLFEMGFSEQLQEVLERLSFNRQTLLFSATLPKMLVDFAKAGLSNPSLVRLDVDEKLSDKLSMIFISCRADDKTAALLYLLRFIISHDEQTIVFCATMKHVEYLAAIIKEAGMICVFLYSQLDAVARKINMQKFRNKECKILVVTDVAARGVDIPILDTVINFDFPPKAKLFVHRVGRVARMERQGKAISLFSADELAYVADLFLFLGRPLKFATLDSVHSEKEAIIGAFPDEFIDVEADFLHGIHETSIELEPLKLDPGIFKEFINATKKYKATRQQPSAESVRRTKKELREDFVSAATHPIFKTELQNGNERRSLLLELNNFKTFQAYVPSDFASERALAVDRGFDAAIKASAIDINADDDTGMYNQPKRKIWDRKKKRFVGPAGDMEKKKVRTEDGTWLHASYKSGRYEKWKQKQKLRYWETNDNNEEIPRCTNRINLPYRRHSELKNAEQILKERRRKQKIKEYQVYRRKENLKKSKKI
ncbi:unnamed protein product [Dracunculus medinensis]|uniref:RNA helicase n=1 Tax=Dracunculus medinensis TaxID=318479 RepID=A0A0N4UNX5_DRAME|nr:unnamed protein product [Dracunculus medinensis]